MAKILLIEDDDLMARMYKDFLTYDKHEVELAYDGETGIAMARTTKPDLILLDFMMPKMNGLEALKKIKADPANKDTTVVILTNLANDEVTKDCMDNGAAGYILKSNLSLDEMLSEVKRYLAMSNKTPTSEIDQA